MRHGKKNNSLSRKTAHRKAMLSNMACSVIEHKRINTTVAKAKALRGYLEPLITKSKTDSTHSRRIVFKYLQSKDAVTELFREIAPKVADRPGGYLRIIRIGNRLGDNAEMCMLELVDFNDLMVKEPKEKKTRRSRRGSGGASTASTTKKEANNETAEKTDTDKKAETKKTESKAKPKKEEAKEEAKPKAKKEAKKDTPKKDDAKKEASKDKEKKDDKNEK
ncbi:50S ribosomal protein L17 [Brumimicrobium salinarum]|uniref:Large ribosomal subunit protein bL17 n=1 Tax=Brumimicrobium salinarum TaxID=2058658 RepID=A0A2I0R3Q4_9FLAO|nr:50S ribosomal protein L17 [Brumimicrobium salinarum]PKR81207.1 50S ribosomal protein L17 [Brumimicrobium salinarum]